MVAREAGVCIADRYRLVEKLGAGGMGSVWKAEDTKLGRAVAVKLVAARARNDGGVIQRFVQEATLIAKIKSPHVVEIHDFGFDDLYPYLVMELLEGEPLSRRLRKGRAMPVHVVASWTAQLGKALSAAHSLGVIHRDLKPPNVFLVPDGDDEIVKVFDFGIARALDQARITKQVLGQEAILGTPGFMSPEQLRGEDVDARTDLWALGVILYRALTGQMPFQGQDMPEVVFGILRAAPKPPSQIRPELAAEIDLFTARALAKVPAERFQSARELVAAFRTAAAAQTLRSLAPPAHPSGGIASHVALPPPALVPATDPQTSWPTPRPAGEPSSGELPAGSLPSRKRDVARAVAGVVVLTGALGTAMAFLAMRGDGGARDDARPTDASSPKGPREGDTALAKNGSPESPPTAAPAPSAAAPQQGKTGSAPNGEEPSTTPTASASGGSSKAGRPGGPTSRPPPPAATASSPSASPSDLFKDPW